VPVTLSLRKSMVRSLALGDATTLARGELTLDARALANELEAQDERIATVEVHTTLPGESTRVVCAKDVVQPRLKVDGTDPGAGTTYLMENLAVVTCGPIVGFQEGIIDMSGPGAAYTPFSELALVVIELRVVDGLRPHEHEATVRHAGLRAAEHTARRCVEFAADEEEEIHWDEFPADAGLPRIAYVDMLLSQGLLHDTYVLGENARDGLPLVMDPRVVIDTGIVSGNCVSACDKNTTFHHQNNPLIAKLLSGHGKRWNLVGVVLTNEPTRLAEKEASAARAVDLVRGLGAHGAIVTKEGFGNPDADLMMITRGLEQAGIKAVAMTDEYAGTDGGSQSLADTTPEADAIVSTGNANQRVRLPAMQKVIGPLPDITRLAGGYPGSLHEDGSMEVELQAIVGSTNQLGFGRLSCRES